YLWTMGPDPSGPDPHFHRSISESFYVLSGTVRIYDGDRWIDTRPGDFVHVPPGGIHAFRNESRVPASMLLHFAPGAPREGYFEGLPGLAGASAEQRADFFRRHGAGCLATIQNPRLARPRVNPRTRAVLVGAHARERERAGA